MNNSVKITSKPQISVLLPFYNAGFNLSHAIQSILKQTYSSWELILVNNGSTDISPDVAEQFTKIDNRIALINEPQKGIVSALNTGLSHCKGDYIARMDADDVSLPTRLELQYNLLKQNPDLDLTSGIVRYISDNKNDTTGFQLYVDWINKLITHEDIYMNQFIESPLAHPSVMFTKKTLLKYGNYRDGNFPEDYEMWLRWLSMGARCQKIEKEVLLWYDNPLRLSRCDKRYNKQAFSLIKIEYLDKWLKNHNSHFPFLCIWGAGKIGRRNSRLLEKRGHKIIFFIDIAEKRINQKNCIHYSKLPIAGEHFVVSFVNNRGVAGLIRHELNEKGYKEGVNFIMAAGM